VLVRRHEERIVRGTFGRDGRQHSVSDELRASDSPDRGAEQQELLRVFECSANGVDGSIGTWFMLIRIVFEGECHANGAEDAVLPLTRCTS
jgi:hypothetical protein